MRKSKSCDVKSARKIRVPTANKSSMGIMTAQNWSRTCTKGGQLALTYTSVPLAAAKSKRMGVVLKWTAICAITVGAGPVAYQQKIVLSTAICSEEAYFVPYSTFSSAV